MARRMIRLQGLRVGADIENNTLDAFMRLLRGKIEFPSEPTLIQTIRGVGYALRLES